MKSTRKNTNIVPQAAHPLLKTIVSLIDNARRKVAVAVNSELSVLYWHIGKQINESVLNHEKGDFYTQMCIYEHWSVRNLRHETHICSKSRRDDKCITVGGAKRNLREESAITILSPAGTALSNNNR